MTLVPGTGGVFVVKVGGDVVWSRKDEGRFPEITELKQRVRDRAAPDKPLGHSEKKATPSRHRQRNRCCNLGHLARQVSVSMSTTGPGVGGIEPRSFLRFA